MSATAISGDGSVIAGQGYENGYLTAIYRWKASNGAAFIFNPGVFVSDCSAISYDGSILAGWGEYDGGESTSYFGFRWTVADGLQGLPNPPNGARNHSPRAMTPDGRFIVGTAHINSGAGSMRAWLVHWGPDGAEELAGYPGDVPLIPEAVDSTGRIIVGNYGGLQAGTPRRWTSEHGAENLVDLFSSHGLDLSGWTLTNVIGISADGLTYAGNGISPSGHSEGWIATIPAPATLLVPLLAGLSHRRRAPSADAPPGIVARITAHAPPS